MCQDLGIIVSWEKSNLVPSQRVVYLGAVLDSFFQGFSLPAESRAAYVDRLRISVRRVASVILARASGSHVFSDSSCSRQSPPHAVSPAFAPSLVGSGSDSTLVRWDVSCLRDLEWWLVQSRLKLGISLSQVSAGLYFWSDVGWRAHLTDEVVSGLWSPEESTSPSMPGISWHWRGVCSSFVICLDPQ